MTLAFLAVVPVVVGYLAVVPHPKPSWLYRIFVPWIPTLLSMAIVWAFGGEGAICIVMATPFCLLFATLGGIFAAFARARRPVQVGALVVLPLVVGGFERNVEAPVNVRTVTSTIDVDAPPVRVWREIVTVPPIARAELPPALYLSMGFPAPISATIDRAGVGGVRRATFENGVVFHETVTDFEENRLLSFRIAAQTDSIPETTLDPHVTIGGPYFDVLQGTYRLAPRPGGGTRMTLESRLRVSTHFNLYSGPWVDAIMRSIQETILVVEKRRAEAGPATAS